LKLELKQLRIDGGTQPREQIDDNVVADYMERLREGVEFPPVVVFFDSSAYWLADGFHRYYANRRLARTHIEAEVHEGTQRDAILYSVGANCEHGLRRSNADKRKAVATMLTNDKVSMDDDGNPWSDREVARRCRVSPHTVARYRDELDSSHTMQMRSMKGVDLPAERTFVHHKTGKPAVMNTKNIGKSQSKPKHKWGELAHNAQKPIRGHSEFKPRIALELPYDPECVARTLLSVFGDEFVVELISKLQERLKGVHFDPQQQND